MCCVPCRFLAFPHFLEVRVLALKPADLGLDQFEPLDRRFVLLLLHRLTLDLELDDATVELVHRLRLGVDLHLDARSGLVDQVDCLVGQEAVGDVAVAELGRGNDRRVGDVHTVMQLVALLQSAQDRNGRLDTRLIDQHLLEAALERRILLDVLAVLVERGGADAVQLTARQCRFQHIAGIDCAFGLAGADHRVHLVDEKDDATRLGGDFLQHGLEPLLEFTPVLGPGQQAGHVEHENPLSLQRLGHFLVDDALGQALDDRRLADPGFADQHRVVLRAPLQDLDRAADLVVAADHRVELALLRALGQVNRVLLQCLALAFGFGSLHRGAAAHRIDRGLERLATDAMLARQPPHLALVVGHRQQEHLARDVAVAAFLRFLVGRVQQARQVATDLDLAVSALDLRQALDGRIERRGQCTDVRASALKQRTCAGIGLPKHRQQHMDRLDVRVVVAGGN
jgi:hypothetical protein